VDPDGNQLIVGMGLRESGRFRESFKRPGNRDFRGHREILARKKDNKSYHSFKNLPFAQACTNRVNHSVPAKTRLVQQNQRYSAGASASPPSFSATRATLEFLLGAVAGEPSRSWPAALPTVSAPTA
jgi:hypothetical protein